MNANGQAAWLGFWVRASQSKLKGVHTTGDEQRVWRKVDEQRDVYIEFLQELVRAWEGGEEPAQQLVAHQFKAIACDDVED